MKELIQALIDLLPFASYLGRMGLSKEASVSISTILSAIFVFFLVYSFKYLLNRWKNTKTARELIHFQYSYNDVKLKRDLYIPTQAQNVSPSYEDEPQKGTKFIVKKPLIPFFVKTAFNEKTASDKFYLILGDSGMGKTTFMINLYLKYNSFFNFRAKYQMKLFPFGDGDILKWIKEIAPEDARNTILLLDAFDEYKALRPPAEPDCISDDDRFRKVLDEIIKNVKDFREVVITSRTQYFPGQEDQPYELKIPRFGRAGFHTLAKLYLSPFEEKEIKRFLNKKYGRLKFWNRRKKRIAAAVVKSSPKLMVRPMLLAYIDLFVDDPSLKFKNTYDVYQTLITKWLEREADKQKYKMADWEKFKRDLYKFSHFAALKIYSDNKDNSLLTKVAAMKICAENGIELKDYEVTGQSLLTRDVSGNWKFAHKSILEYFIATEAIQNLNFAMEIDWTSWDDLSQFYYEMVIPENIDLFVDDPSLKFLNAYVLFRILILKWLEREADKRKYKAADRTKFKQDLYKFSYSAALKIYSDYEDNSFLTKDAAMKICAENGIELEDYEVTGQSLLTRDVSGSWNFVHKFILDYFIATEAIQNPNFAVEIDWTRWTVVYAFYHEVVIPENFVILKGGTFRMGDKEVNLSHYCIGKYPVTQKEWQDIMGHNPSHFVGNNLPVERVSWNNVQEYIKKLNYKTGKNYRLPSEAEWEFAARGGIKNSGFEYAGSNNLDTVGWYGNNSGGKTHPVGEKTPNELGLFDMSGNVWEWCQDWDDSKRQTNMIRGGSFNNGNTGFLTCSFRGLQRKLSDRSEATGFRLAHSL